jgi:hypothetical protein
MTIVYVLLAFWAGGAIGFFTAALMQMTHEEPEAVVYHGGARDESSPAVTKAMGRFHTRLTEVTRAGEETRHG